MKPIHAAAFALLATATWTVEGAAAQAPCEAEPTRCPDRLDQETSRGLALGLGLRATAISTSALAYNTAGLAAARVYHAEASADYLGADDTVAVGGAVADSSTSSLAAGLALRGFLSSDTEGYHGIDGRLGLALPFTERLSIGLGARYVNVGAEVTEAGSDEPRDIRLVKGFTLDGAVRLAATDQLQLAVMGYNLIDRDSPLLPVMAGASAVFAPMPALALGVDTLLDFSSFGSAQPNIGLGAEYLAGQTFPIRAGYSFDNGRELHRLTAGVGYTGQMMGLDVSLRQDVAGGDDTRVLGAVRLYVE